MFKQEFEEVPFIGHRHKAEKSKRLPSGLWSSENNSWLYIVKTMYWVRDKMCRVCGESEGTDLHHIKPRCEGGTIYDLSNLVFCCSECHGKFHALKQQELVETWRLFDELGQVRKTASVLGKSERTIRLRLTRHDREGNFVGYGNSPFPLKKITNKPDEVRERKNRCVSLYKKGFSVNEIVDETGLTDKCIYSYLRDAGIMIRKSHADFAKDIKMAEVLESLGFSIKQSSSVLGVLPKTIKAWASNGFVHHTEIGRI